MHEECGIFGIYSKGNSQVDVARMTYFGLYALQHRGQESAGIAVSDGEKILIYKDLGLVSQVFTDENLATLHGDCAIGHVRYSTTGGNNWRNSQPLLKKFNGGTFSLAHNGNIINQDELRTKLEKENISFHSSSDSEIICNLIVSSKEKDIEEAVKIASKQLKGAFCEVIMTEEKLIGVKGMNGFHPLAIGKMGDSYLLASENCAFSLIGAEYIREVKAGEMIVIDKNGMRSYQILPKENESICIFEFVYLARPDSDIFGENVAVSRQKMGRKLAKEHPVEADIVIPVPDSGRYAALGYSYGSGIQYEEGLLRNHYVGRTFIQPMQSLRENSVKIKLSPIKKILEGKRVVLVDDSIVRGTTSKKLVKLIRGAGAREVHLRICSPPVMCPCSYGIDTPDKKDLWAANHTLEETRKWLGADTLGHISIEGLSGVFDKIPATKFCKACFNGVYPI